MPDMDRQLVVRDMPFPDCPIRNVLARIADKWSLLVLYTLLLHDRPVRFKELQRSVPDISQKMLTTTLRTLEQDGYVRREVFAEVPPRVEYSATKLTASLIPHLNALFDWAFDNMAVIVKSRADHSS